MGKRTGNPRGRPPGSHNKASIERQRKVAETGITPLDYMLEVLRDPKSPIEDRKWAADKAAPYVHPRLSSVEGAGKDGAILVRVVTGLAKDD